CCQPSAVGYTTGSKQQSVRGALLQVIGSLRNKRKCRTICSVSACFRSLHHDGSRTSFEDFSCKWTRVTKGEKDAEWRILQSVRQHMWGLAQRPGDESDAELF